MHQTLLNKVPPGSVLAAIYTCSPASPNLEAQRTLAQALCAQGLGLYGCGSTGQGMQMVGEHRQLVSTVLVETADGRVPVMIQVGSMTLREACEHAEHAQSIGADAISAKLPPGTSVADGIRYHETAAAAASETPYLPYFLGDMPGAITSYFDELRKRIPNLAGTKLTGSDMAPIRRLATHSRDWLLTMVGQDELTVPGFFSGAHGAIGSTWNYWGDAALKIWLGLIQNHPPKLALEFASAIEDTIATILAANPDHQQSALYSFARAAIKIRFNADIGPGLAPETTVDVKWDDDRVRELLEAVMGSAGCEV